MDHSSQQPSRIEPASPNQRGQPLVITPELVKKIADQVYAMLQRDLAIERERSRQLTVPMMHRTGRNP